jgi:DNA-binding PadR family transcriptional regulator
MTPRAATPNTTSLVILGLVGRRSESGYDIAARAARSVANFWPISRSQVYSELARLEQQGLIRGTHVEQDRRPDKRTFAITAAGDAALAAWVGSPGSPGANGERVRSEALARFFFAGWMTPEQRVQALTEYRDHARAHGEALQATFDRLADRPESHYGRATALFGLMQARTRVTWAEHMLAVEAGGAELGARESAEPLGRRPHY